MSTEAADLPVVALLGAGAMGTALLRGWTGLAGAGRPVASEVLVVDADPVRADVAAGHGARPVEVTEAAEVADVLVVAVKPPVVAHVVGSVAAVLVRREPPPVVLSVAAGVTLERLAAAAGPGVPVVRAMPNTPALVGRGATGVSTPPGQEPGAAARALPLLEAVGVVEHVTEPLLDAVTGLSGSGPAYVMVVLEAMVEAGVAEGLPRDVATRLATATVEGAGALAAAEDVHPAVLRGRVTSPGGTTAQGLAAAERGGLRAAVAAAVEASAAASRRMAAR